MRNNENFACEKGGRESTQIFHNRAPRSPLRRLSVASSAAPASRLKD